MTQHLKSQKWTRCKHCKKKFYAYQLIQISQLRTNHRKLGYKSNDLFCEDCLRDKKYLEKRLKNEC